LHKCYITKKLMNASKYGYKGDIYDQSFQGLSFRLFWGENGYTDAWIDNFKLAKRVSTVLRLGALAVFIAFIFRISGVVNSASNPDIKILEFSFSVLTIHLFHSLTWEHHLTWRLLAYILLFIFMIRYRIPLSYRIAGIASYLIVALRYGYDNKIFTKGVLILFTGIKLYGIIILWVLIMILILKKIRADKRL